VRLKISFEEYRAVLIALILFGWIRFKVGKKDPQKKRKKGEEISCLE
jgi:hypothetical protein